MRNFEFIVGRDYKVVTPYFLYSSLNLIETRSDKLVFVNLNDEDCETVDIDICNILEITIN